MPEIGEPPFYTSKVSSTVNRYHANSDCNTINDPTKVAKRSASFVEWHDLNPCWRCYDEVEVPSNAGSSVNTIARELGSDDDDKADQSKETSLCDGGEIPDDVEQCVLCGAELLHDIEFDTGVCDRCTDIGGEGYNAVIVAPTSQIVHAARVDRRDESVSKVQCGQPLPDGSNWTVVSRSSLDEYADEYTPCAKCNLRRVVGVFAGISALELEEPLAYPFEEHTVLTDGGAIEGDTVRGRGDDS
jgi:hypothetical protein